MSSRKKKHRHKHPGVAARSAHFVSAVLQNIRQHARRTPHIEICGALIGRQSDTVTFVVGAVPGEGATQGGAHVTFTQEAWVRIHEEKDRLYPGQAIVGWYHSHPGFGVFLSDHDIFIHKNFFASPGSLAWVYDPHSDEEGCFGWNGGEVRRLDRFEVVTDANKRTTPQREPLASMHSKRTESLSKLAFWRYPKASRALFLIAIATLLVLTFGIGWFVLRDSPAVQRFFDKFTHVRSSPQSQSASQSKSMKHKEQAAPSNISASNEVLPQNHKNNLKRDGGHDEQ